MNAPFPLYDRESAPKESRGVLRAMRNKFGFDLNLFGKLASSPQTLKAYTGVNEIFARGSLSPLEQQVVLLTVSHFHGCDYCVAAHVTGSLANKLPSKVIRAVAAGQVIEDAKLEALRRYTRQMVEQRGHLQEGQLQAFLDAGYSHENALEVITGIALKTISNYANHIMDTPLDEPFNTNLQNK